MVMKILVFLYSFLFEEKDCTHIYIYGYGKSRTIEKNVFLKREQFYLDWALKTYGLNVLNLQPLAGSTLGYRHTASDLLKMSELKKGSLNPMNPSGGPLGEKKNLLNL